MTQTNKQPVTNEELARMIAEGFAETSTKKDVSRLEGSLMDLDASVNGLDNRLTIVENKLDQALYKEFERVDKLEGQMKVVL